jgi:hypothetical protein
VAGLTNIARFAIATVLMQWASSAQNDASTRPALSGVVKDQTGATLPPPGRNGIPFPGADIRVVDLKTGQEFRTTGDQSGAFHITYLEKARYRVKVSMPGFNTWARDMELSTESPVKLEVVLLVGTSQSSSITPSDRGSPAPSLL